jgi:hypothetical protein
VLPEEQEIIDRVNGITNQPDTVIDETNGVEEQETTDDISDESDENIAETENDIEQE